MHDIYPIIGMSPGNSYFKDDVVKALLKKVIDKYGRTAILIADIPAISTYVALGYPLNRARRDKALPQGNNLKNKVLRATSELEYSADKVKIIDWETEIAANTDYLEKYQMIESLYSSNTLFQQAADKTTKEVLESSGKDILNIQTAIKTAVRYLISEFSFLEFAPNYLNAKEIIYVYHKHWPVFEQYIAGEYDSISKPYLRFEIL